MADAIGEKLDELRAQWEDGYFPAAIEAFQWCAANERPLPQWLAETVNAALHFTLLEGGRAGRGKKGGYLPQARRAEVDEWRWRTATHALQMRNILKELGHEPTRPGAFEYASELLQGTAAQGSAGAIEDSYNKVQSAKRTG